MNYICSNKGLNLPRASLAIPAITDKDRHDLSFVLAQQVDWIGLSFVRTASEVLELKELIRQESTFGRAVPVIAKIEKPEAVHNIDDIIAATDAVMVARGDLAVETSLEEVPVTQKMIIRKANQAGKPVITATQMLESMIHNPRPTRAEASDVANAILDGTDAIMLSGETAAGQYPVLTVQTMVKIAERAEASWGATIYAREQLKPLPGEIAEAVAHATRQTAADLGAAAIITPTASGATARLVSKYRPDAPIVAVTPSVMTQRQLALVWGVTPLLSRRVTSTDELIADAIQAAQARGVCQQGDVVVITAGSPGAPGTTNLMKVQVIERILAQGTGIGHLYGGIEAGGTKLVCAVGSGPDNILAEVQFPTTTPDETIGRAVDFLRAWREELTAIGVASFGPVDLNPASPTYGFITSTPKPGWANTDIAGRIRRELDLPVGFDTDVNGAALGEHRWGSAQGLDTFIYLTIGTGIGGGGMVGGQLMHGLIHPEMGHIRVPHDLAADPFPGICPYHGDCLEGLASGPALEARWGQPAETLPPDHPAWPLQARYLALALVNFICILSPQRIILGGGVMNQPQLFPLIRARVPEFLAGYVQSPKILERIDHYIVPPALGSRAGVLGAMALAARET